MPALVTLQAKNTIDGWIVSNGFVYMTIFWRRCLQDILEDTIFFRQIFRRSM